MIRYAYIVDDDDAVRGSLHALLSTRSDLVLRTFATGNSFSEELGALEPGVVLLELCMPGLSGIEVLKQMKEAFAHRFETIIHTGHGTIPLTVEAMRNGAYHFLEKPCSSSLLLSVLDQAFAKQEASMLLNADHARASQKLKSLSQRELDVLLKLVDGCPNKQIAKDLGLSPRTVEYYRANLMSKLGVRTLSDALKLSFKAGMFQSI